MIQVLHALNNMDQDLLLVAKDDIMGSGKIEDMRAAFSICYE